MHTLHADIIIIGGGQAGLACGYYLRRLKNYRYRILDAQESPGGAWQHTWKSLTTFSPAQYSSLPGWLMPKTRETYPTRDEVIDYLTKYEQRYQLPVERPVLVTSIQRKNNLFHLRTSSGPYSCRALISATGTWQAPFIPDITGRHRFTGKQIHSAQYTDPEVFKGKKALVVGEGNSGAQIMADLLPHADPVHWATRKDPEFLPQDVDGSVLFHLASAKYYAEQKGETFDVSKLHLGNIVLVPGIREAYQQGQLVSRGTIKAITETGVIWTDGSTESYDAFIWCTGFHYATKHLKDLISLDEKGKSLTLTTRSKEMEGLWLVGYGGWTGFASATTIGVGRYARQTVQEVKSFLEGSKAHGNA